MASSSACDDAADDVEGTMVWVNLNHLKPQEWQTRLGRERQFITGSFVHAFTMHDTSRAGVVEENRWWSQQSHVHAHVIAPVRLPRNLEPLYPRTCDGLMVIVFLPRVSITEDDFPPQTGEVPGTRLMDCTHGGKELLWRGVLQALETLHQQAPDRGERRHFTGSIGMVRQGLRAARFDDADVVIDGTLGQPSGALTTPSKINVQKKLPSEAAREYDPRRKWPSLEEFMTKFENEKLVDECDVTAFPLKQASTGLLLHIASEQLKTGLGTAIQSSPIRGIIAAKTPQLKEGPRARKAAKHTTESTTMLLNIDYSKHDNFFTREPLNHYVVWIIERPVLNRLLETNAPHIISHGHYRHVVNQSVDKRRIRVKPPMPETSVNDSNKAIEISLIWTVICDKMKYVDMHSGRVRTTDQKESAT